MSNQATFEDLLDELSEVLERGWTLPFSGGKVFVDGEEARQILEDLRSEMPDEIRKAKAIVADREQILTEAQREAENMVHVAEEKAKALVNQEEVVRQAQAKANELILQGQNKYKEMRRATNEYIDDIMRRSDEALSAHLAELRKTRQNIKATQRNGQQG